MAEEIAFEKGRISNFQGLLTLTLDRVILHTIMHHSLTSTYMPNFTEPKKLSVDVRTYVPTYACTDGCTFDTGFIWSTLSKNWPKNLKITKRKTLNKCTSVLWCCLLGNGEHIQSLQNLTHPNNVSPHGMSVRNLNRLQDAQNELVRAVYPCSKVSQCHWAPTSAPVLQTGAVDVQDKIYRHSCIPGISARKSQANSNTAIF